MNTKEASALRTLRSGFLYLIIAMIVGIAAALAGLIFFVAVLATAAALPHGPSAVGAVAVFILLLLAAAGIGIYAIFGKIRPGMRLLSEVDGRFRICYKGTTLLLVGLAVVTLGLVALAAELAAAGPLGLRGAAVGSFTPASGVLLVGGATAFTGYVMTFVVGAFKLYRRYKNPLYTAAGILFAIDAALSLVGLSGMLAFVGYVLIYTALKRTLFSS